MKSSIELFLRTVVARAYPRVINANREKSWVFFETFLPLLAVAAYVFFYQAINAPEGYIGLVVVGGALYLLCEAIFPAEVCNEIGPSLDNFGDGQPLLILPGVTLVTGAVAVYFSRWSEHRAREEGLIDVTTHYQLKRGLIATQVGSRADWQLPCGIFACIRGADQQLR